MRTLFFACALSFAACTAGGVAVQGTGILLPASGYTVDYFINCKDYVATTGPDGQFTLYGLNADDTVNSAKYVPTGDVWVAVSGPHNALTFYSFKHGYDTTCAGLHGPVQCSKDLFMLTASYDRLDANAPGSDVHVRLPSNRNPVGESQDWDVHHIMCAVNP